MGVYTYVQRKRINWNLLIACALAVLCIFAPQYDSHSYPQPQPQLKLAWAWLIPIATALISAAGSAYASKQAGKRNKTEKDLLNSQYQSLQNLMKFGGPMMERGSSIMNQQANYHQTLASGNRTSAMSLLSPEISSIAEQSRTGMQQLGALGPRGGASSDYLSQVPFADKTAISNLLHGARNDSRAALGSMGTNMVSMGMNAMSGAQSGAMNLLDYEAARKRTAQEHGNAVGSSIWNLGMGAYQGYKDWKLTRPPAETGGVANTWAGDVRPPAPASPNPGYSTSKFNYGPY